MSTWHDLPYWHKVAWLRDRAFLQRSPKESVVALITNDEYYRQRTWQMTDELLAGEPLPFIPSMTVYRIDQIDAQEWQRGSVWVTLRAFVERSSVLLKIPVDLLWDCREATPAECQAFQSSQPMFLPH